MINIKYRDFEDGFFTNVDSQKSKKIIFERSIKCSTFEIIDTNKNHLEEKYNLLYSKIPFGYGPLLENIIQHNNFFVVRHDNIIYYL